MSDAWRDYFFYILNDFGSNYKKVLTIIYARDTSIFLKKFHDKLSNYEAYLKQESSPDIIFIPTNFANKINFNNNGKFHNQ